MPHVGRGGPGLVQGPFGFAPDADDAVGIQGVEQAGQERLPRADLRAARRANRERLARIVGVEGDAVPDEEVWEEGPADAPEDGGTVLGVRGVLPARGTAVDRKRRIAKLSLTRDRHAGEAAAPGPRRLQQEEERRRRVVAGEIGPQVRAANRGGAGDVQLRPAVAVRIERLLRRGDGDDVRLDERPDVVEHMRCDHHWE